MILAPYFWDSSDPNWLKLGIFLCAGGEMWQIDTKEKDKAILKMLKENGFPVLELKRQSDILYAQVDPKANLSEFYFWDEIDPKKSDSDVWRTFQIPKALWPCPIFREHFWKSAGLTPVLSSALELSLTTLRTLTTL
jgi:hypothetical protein